MRACVVAYLAGAALTDVPSATALLLDRVSGPVEGSTASLVVPSAPMPSAAVIMHEAAAARVGADSILGQAVMNRIPFTRGTYTGFPDRFDWHFYRHYDLWAGSDISKDPQSVFVSTHQPTLDFVLDLLEKNFDNGREDRIIYLTGDLWLSRLDPSNYTKLRHFFKKGIWYQAKDVEREGVYTAPDGLNSLYTGCCWESFAAAAAGASLAKKPHSALATWGSKHQLVGIPARYTLRSWLKSSAAESAGVVRKSFEMGQFWEQLSLYRFILSPTGAGVQSPKSDEALLMLTIPITTRQHVRTNSTDTLPAFDDLVSLGWPIIIINSWDEITASKLDEWWTRLSPRLTSFRDNCLTVDGFWGIVTGQTSRCE